jgi:hypothetical protein
MTQRYAVIGNLYLHGVPDFKFKDGDGVIEVAADYPYAMPYEQALAQWNDHCDAEREHERDLERRTNEEMMEQEDCERWEPIEELYRIQDLLCK